MCGGVLAGQNRRDWAARKPLSGSPLGDPRGSRQRAKELRYLARGAHGCGAHDQLRPRGTQLWSVAVTSRHR